MTTATAWAPPGLPPAAARGARDPRSAVKGGVGLLVVGIAFAVLRGVRPDDAALVAWALGIVAVVSVFLVLKLLRAEVLVGPGWLAGRELTRRRWVRSDQLQSVRVNRSGLEHVLTFRDSEGRRVGIVMSDLRLDPRIRRQLAEDVRTSLAAGAEIDAVGRTLLLEDL